MRLTAAALAAMAKAAHVSAARPAAPARPGTPGCCCPRAMDALAEAAKDVHRHRAAGDLKGMTGSANGGPQSWIRPR